MRVIKPNNYTDAEMMLSQIGAAISHPVRKRILLEILDNNHLTRTDFSRLMNLSKATISEHLLQLKKANLIRYNYDIHFEEIEFVPEGFALLIQFLRDLGLDNMLSKHSIF